MCSGFPETIENQLESNVYGILAKKNSWTEFAVHRFTKLIARHVIYAHFEWAGATLVLQCLRAPLFCPRNPTGAAGNHLMVVTALALAFLQNPIPRGKHFL